jgi:hypothetical protein
VWRFVESAAPCHATGNQYCSGNGNRRQDFAQCSARPYSAVIAVKQHTDGTRRSQT